VGEGRAPGPGQQQPAGNGKKNAALAERPLDLVLALLEAYPRLGQPMFPRNTWRQSLVGDEFTDISQELTAALLRSSGRCPLDELNDIGWEHELVVEACDVADVATVYPGYIGGEGACPPEDCGGPGGFAELKELLAGPPSPEREEMRAWAGEDYDPAHFDLAAANAAAGSI
jgi:hypothetical protein